ncbi:MAG TPA: RNA polymerase sigma factor [Ktedonobacteraceae bacterium]|nr:RNA polymerase sigma factor [Ktedonobacteraceae bacterium]
MHRQDHAQFTPAEVDAYYEILVSQYWRQLYAFILRRSKNPQDTEDIVQEAFVHAYYALERYSLHQIRTLQARAWLYKITWNVYCNYMQRTKAPFAMSLDAPEDDLALDLDDEPLEQPEAVFERGEQRRELVSLMDELPAHYRETITLYYFDELSQQEIADLLQRPVGTIKTHMRRGLHMLRKILQAKEEEGCSR